MRRPETNHFRTSKKVLMVTVFEGLGIKDSIAREVQYIIDIETGELLYIIDPCPEEVKSQKREK